MNKKCRVCGVESQNTKCKSCSKEETARQKRVYNERLSKNLCPRCGNKPVQGNKHCEKCSKRNSEKDKGVRLKRLNNNLCVYCGKNSPVVNRKLCKECLVGHKKMRDLRCSKLIIKGLCTRCGENKYLESMNDRSSLYRFCLECYVKHASAKNIGSPKYYRELLIKLEKQNYICPYTGDQIIVGYNSWIDHILPSSKFPELKRDINNIQWTTKDANKMKLNHTEEEFKILIKKIHDHLKL